jgi:hypothetical protein
VDAPRDAHARGTRAAGVTVIGLRLWREAIERLG